MTDAVKVGIVGLGRWAKVLTRASQKSDKLRIVSGYSRSEEKRAAFQQEFGRSGGARSADDARRSGDQGRDPDGSQRAASAGRDRGRARRKARLHREADRQHARGGARDRGARAPAWRHRDGRPQRAADGRHPHHARGDRKRRARPRRLHGGELLQRARARAHARDLALVQRKGARRAALAAGDPPVRRAALSRRRDRRGELDGLEALAGRRRGRRPVDDAVAVRRRQDRLCRLVLDLAGNLRGARVRIERADALRDRFRHLGHARQAASDLRRSTSSAARTATASARS